jgi:Zn-dependent protease
MRCHVILSEQGQTPLDLRFRLFGTAVRVHPFFWLGSAVFGWNAIHDGIEYLLLWIACVFFSILLHEFGHVWMGQAFGVRSHIVLQGLCGLAVPSHEPWERWKRIAISLAGPGIQFLFAALLLVALSVFGTSPPVPAKAFEELNLVQQLMLKMNLLAIQPTWPRYANHAVYFLLQINIYWPLLNLLPVWPLDGGRVSRELFVWGSSRRGVEYSLILSMATAGILALNSLSEMNNGPHIPYLLTGGWFFVIFFAMLAIESFQYYQFEKSRQARPFDYDTERLPWERDADWWKK